MDKIICPACKNETNEGSEFCIKCKYPFKGTEKEKAIHIGRFINEKGVVTDSSDSIAKSQKILFAISALNGLFLISSLFVGNNLNIDIALTLIITVAIFLCALFIKRNPILLTVIPLLIIVGINIFNILVDPSTFLNGILIKILIVGSLGYSIFLVTQANSFKRKFGTD